MVSLMAARQRRREKPVMSEGSQLLPRSRLMSTQSVRIVCFDVTVMQAGSPENVVATTPPSPATQRLATRHRFLAIWVGAAWILAAREKRPLTILETLPEKLIRPSPAAGRPARR